MEGLVGALVAFSEQFVIPDWGELIGLIPVGLAGIVVLHLSWTVYRFATAAPMTRGIRRLEPVPPPGVHMPGPSFAPVLLAVGMFMLFFGLFAGGPWTAIGIVTLVLTLLYWGRESIRDFEQVVRPAVPAGALPAPAGRAPPPGVHVPPPSFRPLLVSIGFTTLVAGLVAGGWLLAIGAVILALTLLGWLRDARAEYVAVERADRTGHLDLGGAPAWPVATFAAITLLVATGLLLGSGILSGPAATASGAPVASDGGGGGGGGGEPTPGPSLPAGDAYVSALDVEFLQAAISVPAGSDLRIVFENLEAVPHNVEIKGADGTSRFKGEIVTGPVVVVYEVPALAAGTYQFVCTVHPNMVGTLTAE